MLAHRLRRWASIETALDENLVFDDKSQPELGSGWVAQCAPPGLRLLRLQTARNACKNWCAARGTPRLTNDKFAEGGEPPRELSRTPLSYPDPPAIPGSPPPPCVADYTFIFP